MHSRMSCNICRWPLLQVVSLSRCLAQNLLATQCDCNTVTTTSRKHSFDCCQGVPACVCMCMCVSVHVRVCACVCLCMHSWYPLRKHMTEDTLHQAKSVHHVVMFCCRPGNLKHVQQSRHKGSCCTQWPLLQTEIYLTAFSSIHRQQLQCRQPAAAEQL